MYAELVEGVLIDWLDEDRLDRVLYVEPDDRGVVLFDMKDEKALPVRKIYRDVLTALEDAKARVLDFDPYLPLPNAEVLPKHRARQDKVWKLIEPLVADEDRAILYKNTRNKLVEKALVRAKEEDLPGKSKHYILKLLRRYWRGGQLKDALLSHYHNSGRPGEPKRDGKKKRGRKGRVKGVNVDKTMQNIITRALKRDYYTLDKNSLYRTYILMLSQDFGVDIELIDGVEVPILDKGKEYLTYNQFWYWFNKERDVKKEIASREGQHAFDTNHRPLKEDSTERAFGPGSVYQADATLLDFWLASSIDRSPIGRAVLYFIVDVFSRMIVGFALNFEGPSWHGAMLALLNMQEDKVAFCKRYGRTIEAHEWPSHHFPKRLHADGGELAGVKANSLQSVGVHIRTDPAGRPDFKGTVEQKFGISNEKNRKWLKGSTPKRKQYGAKDHRLDSVYTLEEFRGVIIDLILHYNSRHEFTNYKLSRGMIRDGVRAVPNELWQWGIKNRSGHLRTWPEDYVQKALLPRAKASISREGLIYKKQRYQPEMDIELLQVKATRKGRQAVTVAYDPTKTSNTIYYVLDGGKVFVPCHLRSHNAYRDIEYFEFEYHEEQKAAERARRSTKKLQDDIELEARLRHRDAEAAANTAAAREGKSKSELLAGTKEGKSHERQLERDTRHFESRDVKSYDEPTKEQEEGLERPLHKLPSPSDSE